MVATPNQSATLAAVPQDDRISGQLDDALTSLLRHGRLNAIHERTAAAVGVPLERALYVVLARIDGAGPLRLSDLAELLGVDVSTASRQVSAVEERGLVAREPVPGDRRAALLYLTAAGDELLRTYRETRRRLIGTAIADWAAADKRALVTLLERFNEAIGHLDDRVAAAPTGRSPQEDA